MLLRRFHVILPALALVVGCASNPPAGKESQAAQAPAKADDKGKGDDAEEKAEKIKKKERELAYARSELKIGRLGVEADEREARNAIEDAELKLQIAMKDRDNFKGVEKPLKLADSKLDFDRSAQRMKESEQELKELENMYKQEEMAELTKELVLQRGRANLEFAKRSLELQQQKMANVKDHELAKKEKEVDVAVERSEKALKEARAKKEKNGLESELKQTKAEHKIDELEAELGKLKKATEKAAEKPAEKKAEAKP